MRGHKPEVAEIEAAVEAQRRRVWDAEDRMEHASRVRGWKDATGARRVLDGARDRLDELQDQLMVARHEEEAEEKRRSAFGPREGIREPATFVCGAGAEQDAGLEVPKVVTPVEVTPGVWGESEAERELPARRKATLATAELMAAEVRQREGSWGRPYEAAILSGDPGDEDEHVSARRGVQIHVALIMQYRSRFVHASPDSADEYAARQRVGLLQGRLQELIDDGVLEGYKVESVEFDMLPKGA